jgi:hypothetical protein
LANNDWVIIYNIIFSFDYRLTLRSFKEDNKIFASFCILLNLGCSFLMASFLLVVTGKRKDRGGGQGLTFPRSLHLVSASHKRSDTKAISPSITSVNLSIGKLFEIKKAALRQHVWFRALSKIERSIVDLTVRYVDNIRSHKLAKIVTAIIEKLQSPTENTLDRLVRTIGLPLTRKISDIAVRLGNPSAASWAEDLTFAKYLAMNTPKS